jgi:hypothetical protein
MGLMVRLSRFSAGVLVLLAGFYGGLALGQTEQDLRTPPRISFAEGQVSFWRPGAEDWAPARVNMPLAPGDELYTGDGANVELQTGSRDFIRGGEGTELGIVNQQPDYLQVKVTAGRASLDLRTLPVGSTVELDTPNAAFTIERGGYYRVEIDGDATHFITRRGGRATVIPSGGPARSISPSEDVVVRGASNPTIETYVAPEPDDWDRWNYARTEHALEAVSSRYVSPDVYGTDTLDSYGSWREVPTYGSVWVPDGIASGWAPYSTGSWVWDPYYGWTWVDDAPWGWAPFHYGRWVFINGFWAWAPGPAVVRPVYAPALVSFFFIGHDVAVRVGIGSPSVCWVALGWGEPLIPWWGRRGFIGRPWWGGWGGPRIVNNVVISRTTVINVSNITFQNTTISNAVVAVRADGFGRGHVRAARLERTLPLRELSASRELVPVRGELPVKPVPRSLVSDTGATVRPPQSVRSRSVVATRPAREPTLPWRSDLSQERRVGGAPQARIVSPPKQPAVLPRPSFGTESGPERPRPSISPRPEEIRAIRPQPAAPQERGAPAAVERGPIRQAAPPSAVTRPEASVPHAAQVPESRARGATRELPAVSPRPEVAVPRAVPQPVPQERRMPSPAAPPVQAAPRFEQAPRPAPRTQVQPPVQVQPQPQIQASPRIETRPPVQVQPHVQTQPQSRQQMNMQPRGESRQQEARPLPGQPANRLFPRQRGGDGGQGR